MGVVKKQRYCPTEDRLVLGERKTPNHILHLLLTVLTAGAWLIVWLILMLLHRPYKCPSCGGKTSSALIAKMRR